MRHALKTNAAAAPVVQPAWQREGTVYILGIDGLTLDIIEPMLERGELPGFAQLAARGCSGRIETILPTNSSLLWTTIATGCHHRDHGIDGFRYYRIGRFRLTRLGLKRLKKLRLRRLMEFLERRGTMTCHLLDGRDVRRKPFWDIFSDAGLRVCVVNWWHTWPAEPVNGHIVSDRLFHWRSAASGAPVPDSQLTHPEDLLADVSRLATTPADVTADDVRPFVNLDDHELEEFLTSDYRHHELEGELRFLIALDRTCWRLLEHCLDARSPTDVAAVYLRGPDIAQHCSFQYTELAHDLDVSDDERRRFGRAVPQSYRQSDAYVGHMLERLQPQDTLFVLSDHGFTFQKERGQYGHARGRPPGIFYAVGSEFEPGRRVENATIYDFTPTLLRVCGFPPSAEMPGRCLEKLLTPEFRRKHPPLDPIPTYGPRTRIPEAAVHSEQVDERIKEHLKALGYYE